MSKFHENGDHGVTHDDSPEDLARKLYDDPNYFEDNPRGYKGMGAAARQSAWHDAVCQHFANVIPVANLRLLDVGCATGAYLRPLIALGADAYGIELSEYAAGVAQEVVGVDRVHRGSAHDMPMFDEGSFDIYFSTEMIEHVPYRYHLDMLREAFRVLRPGGLLYLQGQIGFKDYLNPDPNDDAGHIAVFPMGYWRDMVCEVGFALDSPDAQRLTQGLLDAEWWQRYAWRFLIAVKPLEAAAPPAPTGARPKR